MTLGGLALAVGILVDDATVAIENIHRNLAIGSRSIRAILDGAQQIAMPAFVSTLCICIVFVPVVFLTGVGKYLFVPLAEAVVFAMLASYFLSRTARADHGALPPPRRGATCTRPGAEDTVTERVRSGRFTGLSTGASSASATATPRLLGWALAHRRIVRGVFAGFVALSLGLFPLVGRDFFPTVDAGQIRLHVRAPAGTRIEETARRFAEVEEVIRQSIPPHEIETCSTTSASRAAASTWRSATRAGLGRRR